jgi:hypothetical protein
MMNDAADLDALTERIYAWGTSLIRLWEVCCRVKRLERDAFRCR